MFIEGNHKSMLNDSLRSWNSPDTQSVNETVQLLFGKDDMVIDTDYAMDKIFIQPNGFCYEFKNVSKLSDFAIDLQFDAELFLIEPLLDNSVFFGSHSMVGDSIQV